MDVLFLHPNFPGQFLHLAKRLSQDPAYRVSALGDESWMAAENPLPLVKRLSYPAPEAAGKETHPYVAPFEAAVRRGQQVVRILHEHRLEGYEPDIIYVHPGWGDGLYLKEVFPNTKIIGLFEYFYHARGADVGFDPEFPLSFNDLFRVRTLNTIQLHALEGCDVRLSPTRWQQSRYPELYQKHITPLHEGIDTSRVAPNPKASITLPDGLTLNAGDEVLTYISRGLEPYRGFHSFMRALPVIMHKRPNCQVVIVGGDKSHYGRPPANGGNWREVMLQELDGQLDLSRIHFTGMLGFEDYVKVLQISRAHVYLTYPFILSWSMLEAMAAGCLVIGSDTPPVREYLQHDKNGLLFPFFDTDALIKVTVKALQDPDNYKKLRKAAAQTIKKQVDFDKVIYQQHLDLMQLALTKT